MICLARTNRAYRVKEATTQNKHAAGRAMWQLLDRALGRLIGVAGFGLAFRDMKLRYIADTSLREGNDGHTRAHTRRWPV